MATDTEVHSGEGSVGTGDRLPNPDRARRVDDLQEMLRLKNKEVGGHLLVEVPLGDGTDRVVQILRPDALKHVSETAGDDFEGQYVDKELLDYLAGENKNRYPAIPVVLPEIGNAWVFGSLRYMNHPGLEEFAQELLEDKSMRRPSEGFLEVAKGNGLFLAKHLGIEEEDTPSYERPVLDVAILSKGASRFPDSFKIREVNNSLDGWKGGVPAAGSGIVPVRGNASIELFNLAIKGAFDKAKEIQRGPGPDRIIRNTINLVEDLR